MNPRGFVEDLKSLPSDRQILKYTEDFGPEFYHRWYYNRDVWRHVSFMGVYCAKNVMDLWNYQEIIWNLKPGLVVELGTYAGGSAMYLSWVMFCMRHFSGLIDEIGKTAVLTVDIDWTPMSQMCAKFPGVMPVKLPSTSSGSLISSVQRQISRDNAAAFFILDSDHHKDHVLAELEMLRTLTRPGDYVVVEDSNINGHPVLPDFGPGPWEAIAEYEARHPEDYRHDTEREGKFGFTFAPRGYLIKQAGLKEILGDAIKWE